MESAPRVLHVVEAFGGGVADAVRSFVSATPEIEHHLLYALRDGITVDAAVFECFRSATPLPNGHFARIVATRRLAKELQPAAVHAHSSFAGVYVRAGLRRGRTPIIYSPHCFSFERRDVSAPVRIAFRAIERIFADNTSVFAVCSHREVALARGLSRRPVQLIVNVARSTAEDVVLGPRPRGEMTVVMTGRLAPQKGVGTFARLAEGIAARGVAARTVWIGGGEEELGGPLHDAGVKVTGWIDPQGVRAHLAAADLYVHTAEWEGFPVGLLEAVAMGVPSLVLARPYAEGLPAEMTASDDELVDRVIELVGSEEARRWLAQVNAWAFAENTPQTQADQLRAVYGRLTGATRRNGAPQVVQQA